MLEELGLADWDSPFVAPPPPPPHPTRPPTHPQPIMLFNPAKLPAVSRYMLARGLAIVVVRPSFLPCCCVPWLMRCAAPAAPACCAAPAAPACCAAPAAPACCAAAAGLGYAALGGRTVGPTPQRTHPSCARVVPTARPPLAPPPAARPRLAPPQVGFPATPLLTARMRVCISAAHSRADLDYALEVFRDLVQR